MKNKQILVTQPSMPDFDEYVNEIRSIFESKWLTNMGKKHNEFEQKLKQYLGIKNLSLFTNGHSALYIGIKAMNFPKGSEIITTPFSFASTTHAIIQNGFKPVFCDINEEDYTIDVNKIEEKITKNTVAILPVHVYGHICDVEKIDEIAKKYKLKVIYDAAHTFGVKYKDKSIANYGDISMFSFHATKVFNTIEGGALVYKDEKLREDMEKLKNFGINGEQFDCAGINAKMNEFCAAMGICNLRHIDNEIAKRKKVYNRYIQNLSTIDGIKVPKAQKDVISNYSYLPVIFDKKTFGQNRDEVMEKLKEEDIFTRKYFYPLINEYRCYQNREKKNNDMPIAKKISDNVLTIPLYADLSTEEVDRICEIINKRV